MSAEDRTPLYEAALADWKVCEKIGSGSGGRTAVYRMERRNTDWTEENALKVIHIADEHGIYAQLPENDQAAYQSELARRKKRAETELQTMYALRGLPTIAGFLGHKFVDWQEKERFGCDLLIRMELMECLRGDDGRLTVNAGEAVQIGKDICEALIECHKRNIIHRDIKPANIFINRHGRYQLGDFGISRSVNDSRFASTGICTEAYAAPELLNGEKYTELVDIYSLGLTLYELCNDGELPFAESRYANQSSIERRLTENTLPPPQNADDRLAGIILKACAKDPKDRWQSAQEMLDALQDPYATRPARPGTPKKKRPIGAAAAVVLLLCLGAAARFGLPYFHASTGNVGEATPPDESVFAASGSAQADDETKTDIENPKTDKPTPTEGSKPEDSESSDAPTEGNEVEPDEQPSVTAPPQSKPETPQQSKPETPQQSEPAKGAAAVSAVWSDWLDALPDGISAQTETRTVYRYADYHKETTTSDSQTAPFGYELDHGEFVEKLVEDEVVDVAGHYEYRYGCWVGSDGGHSYCNVMAEKYYGAPAKITYTDWSTTQYINTDTRWTCGSGDSGKHQHSGTGGWIASDTGHHVWPLYSATGSTKTNVGYYWEESRWVDTTYKTEYRTVTGIRYHFYRMVLDYESPWSEDEPDERENRTIERKTQYRYLMTS